MSPHWPVRFTIMLSVILSFAGVATAFAQRAPVIQRTTPDYDTEDFRDFVGDAAGATFTGSRTIAEGLGYFVHRFGTWGNQRPAPTRSFWTEQSRRSPAQTTRIMPEVIGEVGFQPSVSTVTFMGGPRVTVIPANSRVAAYGEFLFGGLHFSGDFSGTDKLMMPAFGALVSIPHNKLKVTAEIGFPIDFFDGFHETDKRFQFGVVLPLNHR